MKSLESELKNKAQQIKDIQISQKNEIALIEQKMSRKFEDQLDDEKHAL